MPDLSFDLEKVVGWFDGQFVNYTPDGNSNMVHYHEITHSRIFQETPDGSILRILVLLLNAGDKTIPNLANLINHLIEISRFAHEIAATYIGIKYLLTEKERVESLAQLTSEYLGYYKYFSSTIDPIAKSTYLQSAIAWSATYFIFSSPLIAEFVRDGLDVRRLWSVDHSPNKRAKDSYAWFQRGALQSALLHAYEKYKHAMTSSGKTVREFDELDTEEAWRNFTRQERTMIEFHILDAVYSWLVENSSLKSLDSRSNEYQDAVKKWAKHLSKSKLKLETGIRSGPTDKGHSLEELQLQAFVQFSNIIHIQPGMNEATRNGYPELKDPAVVASLDCSMLDFCFDRDDPENGRCYVVAWGPRLDAPARDPEPSKYKFQLRGIYRSHAPIAVRGMEIIAKRGKSLKVVRTIAKLSALNIQFEQLYRRISRRASYVFWYEAEWDQLLIRRKERRIELAIVVSKSAESHFFLHFARIDGLKGVFMKALPHNVGAVTKEYYEELFRRGEAFRLQNAKDFGEISNAAGEALSIAQCFWDKL